MSKRHWRLFAEDILECVEKLESYVKGVTFEEFKSDSRTADAVVRNLEIIGEAAKYIPDEVRKRYSRVDWKAVVGLRNRIIHEYFGVDLEVIWRIIEKDVPILREQVRQILGEETE